MGFDRIAILDWSAAKGPKRGKDSIWLAEAGKDGCIVTNLPTRQMAETALAECIQRCLTSGQRLLIGADFAFGAPRGFIPVLTGKAEALSWWAWLADRITDTPRNLSNYRQVAAQMNGRFSGGGPFWGNGEKVPTPGLPRLKPALPPDLQAHRATDRAAVGPGSAPKPIWQLAGAGAVGAQVLTGLPMLHRLCQRFAPSVAVWPFQPPTAPVVLAEVYPSLLAAQVRVQVEATGQVPDQVQVTLLAQALQRLSAAEWEILFSARDDSGEEGCILGAARPDLLRAALA